MSYNWCRENIDKGYIVTVVNGVLGNITQKSILVTSYFGLLLFLGRKVDGG